MQLFVNGVFVQKFGEDVFPVTNFSVQAAFDSKIEIAALEARVKL